MRHRNRFGISRRRLLQGLGLGASVGPLIPLLNASGAESVRPKRLVLFFSPDGAAALDWANAVDWRPTGTETDFTFHAMHAPLEPHKSKVVVPWGLTLTAGGAGEGHAYGMAGIWTGATLSEPSAGADFDGGNGHRTGWGSGPSIDQIVAQAFGPNTPYQSAPTDEQRRPRIARCPSACSAAIRRASRACRIPRRTRRSTRKRTRAPRSIACLQG